MYDFITSFVWKIECWSFGERQKRHKKNMAKRAREEGEEKSQ